jgi:hypothetical protein
MLRLSRIHSEPAPQLGRGGGADLELEACLEMTGGEIQAAYLKHGGFRSRGGKGRELRPRQGEISREELEDELQERVEDAREVLGWSVLLVKLSAS